MGYKEIYERWLSSAAVDEETKAELKKYPEETRKLQYLKAYQITKKKLRNDSTVNLSSARQVCEACSAQVQTE